jgi:hypothetical protein
MDEETALRHLLELIDSHLLALASDSEKTPRDRDRHVALLERARVSVKCLLHKLLQPTG